MQKTPISGHAFLVQDAPLLECHTETHCESLTRVTRCENLKKIYHAC